MALRLPKLRIRARVTGRLWVPVARFVDRQSWKLRGQIPRLRPMREEELGANYDTSWARRRVARFTRGVLLDLVTRPFVNYYASPDIQLVSNLDDVHSPVIFASNHASHIDTSLMLTSLPRRFRRRAMVAAAADYFFNRQWKAALWALWFNVIPIEREKVGRRSAEFAATLIEEGWDLVIFPEGTRSRDGSIAKFRGGAAYLSIRCDVPVVPVYLGGTYNIWRPGRRLPTRSKARVYFGEPIKAKQSEKARELNDRIENAVRELESIDQDVAKAHAVSRWPRS